MLYHGSHNPNLIEEISAEGIGTGTGCSGFFCCDTASRAHEYGKNVYRMNDLPMFDNSDADEDVLAKIVADAGISYAEHSNLCWHAIAAEDLSYDEQESWAELVEKDIDDAMWFAQSLRIELARRQGFQSVGMNDECGSIVILREFAKFERVEICPECGEDKNSEDCDCE
ncbi:MAG: hypothetical protein EOM37_13375 [Proteobacteria bacterium]|nr:hypothetical protein [Pseudomonadota bacterium]